MTFHHEVLGIVYLVQMLIGVLGNFFLIYHYSFHFITQKRPRSINLILTQLSFANAIFLLSRGIPKALFSLEVNIVLNDGECKILSYLQRVFRGLSLCSTCLLSSFQAIAITPSSPKWEILKIKSPKSIIPCCIFCWIFTLLMDVALLVYTTGAKQNSTKIKGGDKLGFCSLNPYAMNSLKLQIWKSFYDSVFVVLMAVISGYMVFLLYQHHQRVQHIHSSSLSLRVSPEIRATKAILLLLSTFFFFNSLSSVLSLYASFSEVTGPWMFYAAVFLSMSFQAVSPFVLINNETGLLEILLLSPSNERLMCYTNIMSNTYRTTKPKTYEVGGKIGDHLAQS